MGESACVRCSRHTEATLCASCAARLRALLAGRPGIRRSAPHHGVQPYALAAVMAVALLVGFARVLVAKPEAGQPQASGVWRVFADQQFVSPLGAAADRDGSLFIVDAGADRVFKLAPDGHVLATFGGRGTGAGQFERPSAIAVDSIGNLYVTDTANSRVQKLSSTGTPLAQWGSLGTRPGQFNGPRGIAVDREGNVYVGDTGNDRVQKLSPLGKTVAVWGRAGSGPGEFRQPYGLAVDAEGAVFVADHWNNRIQKLSA